MINRSCGAIIKEIRHWALASRVCIRPSTVAVFCILPTAPSWTVQFPVHRESGSSAATAVPLPRRDSRRSLLGTLPPTRTVHSKTASGGEWLALVFQIIACSYSTVNCEAPCKPKPASLPLLPIGLSAAASHALWGTAARIPRRVAAALHHRHEHIQAATADAAIAVQCPSCC